MLTRELQQRIDECWDACWPTSKLRPIVILDLVSYLFFIKKISSEQQHNKVLVNKQGFFLQGSKGREEVKGDFFNDPEGRNIYTLFATENGIAELEKEYSLNEAYGSFFKSGLIMVPTPNLLENALGIIKIIEEACNEIKGKVFEYLLNKTELVDPTGHVYLPQYLVELLVAAAQPDERDFILDPSSGNGALLVGCAEYIDGKNLKFINKNTSDFDSQKLKGMESDITSLRIAAMNLILHGINVPVLRVLDIFSPLNSITSADTTVFIANLIFLPGENNRNVEVNAGKGILRKEIYYLDFILKNLADGARCVIIVPDIILYQIGADFVAIRQALIEDYKLDAVISIEEKQFPLFNGASILAFSKEVSSSTDKVWFYKLKLNNPGFSQNLNSYNTGIISKRTDELAEILEHFENKERANESGNGFYINADEIRAKNYNFSYNEYNLPMMAKPSGVHAITIRSTDLPKWEPKKVNVTTSLLQPVSKASSRLITNKVKIKRPDWQKLFSVTRKTLLPKKIISKKILLRSLFVILLFGIGYLFWFVFLQNDTVTKIKTPVIANITSDSVKRSPKFSASSLHNIDSVEKTINDDLSKEDIGNNKTSFKVISKAYLYSSPALSNPEDVYITNANNETLIPLKEENGFVYVDYINNQGKNTKGWLNTNDLEATSSSTFGVDNNEKDNHDLAKEVKYKTTKYVIKTKTYFYLKPDVSTRLDLYLAKPNHTQLVPLKEENGFVYVVYTNTKGKNTSGWLSKKDLTEVEK